MTTSIRFRTILKGAFFCAFGIIPQSNGKCKMFFAFSLEFLNFFDKQAKACQKGPAKP